ncbi:MAG: hypothetical protein HOF23_04275 [Rhodospirillaceae bacterium]|nr:hypothetical protein [Rhodospirillaceae bacterium]
MNVKNIAAGLALSAGLIGFGANIATAEGLAPLPEAQSCGSQIQFPQNKEELTLADVKRAVEIQLQRIGAENRDVQVELSDEDIITANITHRGRLLRQIKVDAANAAIIERRNYGRPVGFDAPLVGVAGTANDEFMQRVKYTRQLRRHMLGDGKTWGDWLGNGAKGFSCRDDYRFGGPEMKEPGT